jgi:hypothetical protein
VLLGFLPAISPARASPAPFTFYILHFTFPPPPSPPHCASRGRSRCRPDRPSFLRCGMRRRGCERAGGVPPSCRGCAGGAGRASASGFLLRAAAPRAGQLRRAFCEAVGLFLGEREWARRCYPDLRVLAFWRQGVDFLGYFR